MFGFGLFLLLTTENYRNKSVSTSTLLLQTLLRPHKTWKYININNGYSFSKDIYFTVSRDQSAFIQWRYEAALMASLKEPDITKAEFSIISWALFHNRMNNWSFWRLLPISCWLFCFHIKPRKDPRVQTQTHQCARLEGVLGSGRRWQTQQEEVVWDMG